MNKSYYKIYQLFEFFALKYDYRNYLVKELNKPEELWLFSKTNKSYNLIRISNYSVNYIDSDKERIDSYIDAIKKRNLMKEISFLDLHINSEDITNDRNIYDTTCMDIGFISGINLEDAYPGIKNAIHEVDYEEQEIKRIINAINQNYKDKFINRKNKVQNKIKSFKLSWSNVIMATCIVMYIISSILQRKYDQSTVLIFLGADYKMFTFGLHEYWRLISSAFLHASFIHVFCNLFSFYYFGPALEEEIGHTKFIIMFLCGIAVSSLTHSVLVGNSISIGLSGGIYTIFVFFIVYYFQKGLLNIRSLYIFIILNVAINFMPDVAWQAHLGGALCGLLFGYIYSDNKINYYLLPVIFLLIFGLFVKCYKDDYIKPYYIGTDLDVVEMYNKEGFINHASNVEEKLYEIYLKEN